MINKYKFRHFFLNKYLVSPVARNKYFISYNYKYKTVWFRTYKVASRTIRSHFEENTPDAKDIYSSEVGYIPAFLDSFYRFAFVREPVDKFISAWKNKVLQQNYFEFSKKQHEQMKDIRNFISYTEDLDIDKCDEHLRAQNSLIDLNNLNFLGRFENFNDDFKELCNTVGLPVKDMPVKNKSKVGKGIVIDDKSIQRIQTIYEQDIRIFYPDALNP